MRVAPDRWLAFLRPAKRVAARRPHQLRSRRQCLLSRVRSTATSWKSAMPAKRLLAFDLSGPFLDEALHAVGHVPLPPYIASKRDDDARDLTDYQTISPARRARWRHQRPDCISRRSFLPRWTASGIERAFRHAACRRRNVSAGEGGRYGGPQDACRKWRSSPRRPLRRSTRSRARGGRIVAVGTTSLRLLESAADEDGQVSAWSGETAIFITPGYRFKAVDVLMTNFHLPRSTLFMLVSAFAGLEPCAPPMRMRSKAAIASIPTEMRGCSSARRP